MSRRGRNVEKRKRYYDQVDIKCGIFICYGLLKTPGNDRKTGLASKLRKQLGITVKPENVQEPESKPKEKTKPKQPEDYILTPEKIYSGEIDPMIGMEDIHL